MATTLIKNGTAVIGQTVSKQDVLIKDEKIAAIVDTWPSLFDTTLADGLGFSGDAGFDAILDQALRM